MVEVKTSHEDEMAAWEAHVRQSRTARHVSKALAEAAALAFEMRDPDFVWNDLSQERQQQEMQACAATIHTFVIYMPDGFDKAAVMLLLDDARPEH